MRLTIFLGVLLLGAAALAAPSANATDFCTGGGMPIDVAGQAYVAIDVILDHGYLFSIWVYAESNGEAGLQRGGETLLGDRDPCQESANPDTGVA